MAFTSEEDLVAIFDFLPIGAFLLRLEDRDEKEFRLVAVNRTNSEIVGVDLDQFIGKTLREAFPDAYGHGLPDKYIEALSSGKRVMIGEMQYGDAVVDPQTFYLEAIPISQDLVMLTTENISQLKRTKLVLEQKNDDLEHFMYAASHDLKEPLRGITSFMNLLYEEYGPKNDEQFADYVLRARDGANRLSRLIEGLLDYSSTGSTDVDMEPVDLTGVVNRVLENLNLSTSVDTTNTVITVDELPIVHGYHTMLVQLFQNLISNAIKFRKEGESPKIQISLHDDPDWILVSVTDDGIGIAPEFHARAFEMFKRLNPQHQYSGTGIGLALCRKIMEIHHGRIELESTLGQGAKFTLYFVKPTN